MSRVYSVRFTDEQAELVDAKGGSSWIKEQVLAVLGALGRLTDEPLASGAPPSQQALAEASRIVAAADRTRAVLTSEEEYVAREVAITKAQMEAGVLKEVDYQGRGRLERAEAYARWRWREYHSGNVASL